MFREIVIGHEFVEFIPETIQDGKLYISQKYRTAVHKCCCGCGREVVTPLSDVGWQLFVEGELISLSPSVGNWNLPCQSHYLIIRSRVVWAGQWTQKEIDQGRRRESAAKQRHYAHTPKAIVHETKKLGFWRRLWNRLFPTRK